jgi:hypothetical protein
VAGARSIGDRHGLGGLDKWLGAVTSIADFNNQEIVLLDTGGQRYATLPLKQLADELGKGMAAMPPEARAAMASIKIAVEAKGTGRTTEIQGVVAEEKEVVITMEGIPVVRVREIVRARHDAVDVVREVALDVESPAPESRHGGEGHD